LVPRKRPQIKTAREVLFFVALTRARRDYQKRQLQPLARVRAQKVTLEHVLKEKVPGF
jgi:hypothetical protein